MTKKATVMVDASELFDADVEFVSLVNKGANRLPFRVLKTEGGGADTQPSADAWIEAITVVKGEGHDELMELMGQCNLNTEDPLTVDGSGADIYMYMQPIEGAGPDELADLPRTILKVDDRTSFVIASNGPNLQQLMDEVDLEKEVKSRKSDEVEKTYDRDEGRPTANVDVPYEYGSSFFENVGEAGFTPGLHLASAILVKTINAVMHSSPTAKAAHKGIAEAVGAYKNYVTKLASMVPSTTFQLEALMVKTDSEVTDGPVDPINPFDPDTSFGQTLAFAIDKLIDSGILSINAEVMKTSDEESADSDGEGTVESQVETDVTKTDGQLENTDSPTLAAAAVEESTDTTEVVASSEGEVNDTTQAVSQSSTEDDKAEAVENSTADDVSASDEDTSITVDANMQMLMDAVASQISEKIGPLTVAVQKLQESHDTVAERMTTVEGEAAQATEAVKGTVVGSYTPTDARTALDASVEKSDHPMLDTGYSSRDTRRRRRGMVI